MLEYDWEIMKASQNNFQEDLEKNFQYLTCNLTNMAHILQEQCHSVKRELKSDQTQDHKNKQL